MLKKTQVVNYRWSENDTQISCKSLENYNELSMFFVTQDGIVIPITPFTDHDALSHIIGGKYLYKEQLQELLIDS